MSEHEPAYAPSMNQDCHCRIEDRYEPSKDKIKMYARAIIIFCPLHRTASAMRNALIGLLKCNWVAGTASTEVDAARQALAQAEGTEPKKEV